MQHANFFSGPKAKFPNHYEKLTPGSLEAEIFRSKIYLVQITTYLVLVFTHLTSFPGCQGGNIKRVKDPWSGGLALPHETQSCQGEKQQPQKGLRF